jgi:methylmalonyl-CoA mutase N-terminal domain/subunit
VNKFQQEESTPIPILKIDENVQVQQIERLKAFKANRDQQRVHEKLMVIQEAARGTNNLMPYVIDAVEHQCTLGEISHALRAVWGEYKG